MKIEHGQFFATAFTDYLPRLKELVACYPDAKLLELGGGRRPSFAIADMPANLASYTVNDIDAGELALAAPEYDKACFDVTGDVSAFAGQFDVVFSRVLIEHVSDGPRMHRNVLKLLKPGGVAFHMAPTLYAAPFVINKLLPEALSQRILWTLMPRRRSKEPKFPAHYSWCYGNRDKMVAMLKNEGYGRVEIRTFYGHDYFRSFPGLRELSRLLGSIAAKRDWSSLGSYAHIVAYK